MDIIEKIIDAVYALNARNCDKKNMIIAFSPLIERYLIEEMREKVLGVQPIISGTLTLMGIKTYGLHPYNEIVVYDSKNASLHPRLIKKIEFNLNPNHILEIKNQELT